MSSITPVEQAHIDHDLGGQEIGYVEKLRITDIPVKEIVTSISFWALVMTGFCISIFDFVVINMLPKYLNYVQQYELTEVGNLR